MRATFDSAVTATSLELLPVFNAGTVELLDNPKLLREARGLERRRGAAGGDRVDALASENGPYVNLGR